MSSPTYCPMAWIGLNILPNTSAPCCFWSVDNSKDITVDFDKVRSDMLEGKQISNCSQCYKTEELGLESRRQKYIDRFGVVTDLKTKILDISIDNLCNLKCRGCASTNSHLLYNDEMELYGETISNKKYIENNFYQDKDFSQLEEINISGGEPFLSKQTEKFIKYLKDTEILKKVKLVGIVTNGTIQPSSVWVDAFNDIQALSITMSIDGIGHLNEYFRSGANFDVCKQQMDFFDQLIEQRARSNQTTQININTTVSIYNVNLLDNVKKFFTEHYPKFVLERRLLIWPAHLSIKNVPDDLKIEIKKTLDSSYTDILSYLTEDGQNLFDHFLNYHQSLDAIRSEDLKNSNPLLSDYIQDYIKKHPTRVNSKDYFITQIKGIIG
jgi:sulfatase maturation enzyme AslB (radical SAM superfamily)